MAKLHIEIGTKDLKRLVSNYIKDLSSSVGISPIDIKDEDITIQVMSNQNYKVKEWERGEFRAIIDKEVD
jgi:hypothetical protein